VIFFFFGSFCFGRSFFVLYKEDDDGSIMIRLALDKIHMLQDDIVLFSN